MAVGLGGFATMATRGEPMVKNLATRDPRMKPWQKMLIMLLIGSFPGGLAILMNNRKPRSEAPPSPKQIDVAGAVNDKAKLLDEIAMKIATTKGEVLKLEENKLDMVVELQALREQIDTLIRKAPGVHGADAAMLQVNKRPFDLR